MNYGSAMEWSAKDLLRAIGMISDITDVIAEQAVKALVQGGEIEDFSKLYSQGEGNRGQEWENLVGQVRSNMSQEERNHFSQAMDVLCYVGINMLTEYRKSLEKVGLVFAPMPNPDTVEVPDSADEIEWE